MFLSLRNGITERYTHVAHERGQGNREVPRRFGSEIARSQLCGYPFDFPGKCHFPHFHHVTLILYTEDIYASIVSSPCQS